MHRAQMQGLHLRPIFSLSMTRQSAVAARRTAAVAQHMARMSTEASSSSEPTVKFESVLSMRNYVLNRPDKLNSLNGDMLEQLRPKIEEWSTSDLCTTIVGTGTGRAFCAGGDVAQIAVDAQDPEKRSGAIGFFKREFEMDYILAALNKPYVAIMDGITMGGGVGLSAPAHFRVVTEKTRFAMPETNIGYVPDVGASYYMSRLDGQLGTYLCLTGNHITGRDVFEMGFATHYIPSRRVPALLERLATVEQFSWHLMSGERLPEDPPFQLTGDVRVALDYAFRHDTVEQIVEELETLSSKDNNEAVRQWASETLATLKERSPTSLKLALYSLRKGKNISLLQALRLEHQLATAYCNMAAPDFVAGITNVLVTKSKEPTKWSPDTLKGVTSDLLARFVGTGSTYTDTKGHSLEISEELLAQRLPSPYRWSLPSEEEIGAMVKGSHKDSGGTSLKRQEVLDTFERLRERKLGVKEKVAEVLSRRCTEDKDGFLVWN
ncbi:ClpP/crotonase-like domain-containing protein [Schizophyllum amplum]|uniref:3-hydroxyisobutyryl-CoA hydrolase n=1 Tax=Schizophyllum amplum TaxID=97359 RepID=A0A550C3C6_9AGAR|nr:ClpP/crotonase-like domain-containing protein [Auriculariopsis ampla]